MFTVFVSRHVRWAHALASRRLWIVALVVLCCRSACAEISFNRDIRPILSDACFYCHGPDAAHREADLRLDDETSAKEYAIVPSDLEASELWLRVQSADPDAQMPPPDSGKKLTDAEKDLLKRWIEGGAVYEPYWAYVTPRPTETPRLAIASQSELTPPENESARPLDPIDHYVMRGIRRSGLRMSPPADRNTLIRRVTFDLTGLPPGPDRLRDVLTDSSPAAYARYVDELLASPAYGERMAAYWLDLVRYADTVGYHGDQDQNISPYRDYVIGALNQNMPLDQFTREQIAGDLLDDPTIDQLVATGYNRLLQTSHEGGVQPKEYLAIYAADRVRNFSAVWMGATVGCAQCHDHKYDPYTARDFYSLSAFFADIDEAQHFDVGTNALPTKRPPEIVVVPPWDRRALARIESEIASLQHSSDDKDAEPLRKLQAKRDRILREGRKTMVTQAIKPRETRVLPRGNWLDDSGEIVSPAVPTFMPPVLSDGRRATRLDLANWLVDPSDGIGGLTARVFVNRFWYLMFGRGLSSSLADFGGQGEPPSHPELLDRLAIDFVQSGWDVKALLRRLVMTRTYQQSSVPSAELVRLDPQNRWFARQSRYRMSAEMVRDNALCVGGTLVRQVGGQSVKPAQPQGYYRHLNFPKRVYEADTDAQQWRRGVYVHWQRQFLHPMLKALDAPSREECTAERPRSNTPLEALVLLNDPTMIDAAKGFAKRLVDAQLEPDQTIRLAYEIALARNPTEQEEQVLLKYFQREYRRSVMQGGNPDLFPDEQTVEQSALIAWTNVCRVVLNLHETVTRD
tara:strand:+ start:161970 stop:164366 length:2397 start_codon:yes stop_codon:yes gene_type:complete